MTRVTMIDKGLTAARTVREERLKNAFRMKFGRELSVTTSPFAPNGAPKLALANAAPLEPEMEEWSAGFLLGWEWHEESMLVFQKLQAA